MMTMLQIVEWLAVAEGPLLIQLQRELTNAIEKRTNVSTLQAVLVAAEVAADFAEEVKFPRGST